MLLTAILKEKEAEADAGRKANEEALAHIAELEKTAEAHKAQAKASKMVSEKLGEDCKWLINRGIPLLADFLMASEELAKYMFELGGATYSSGRNDDYAWEKAFKLEGKPDNDFELIKEDCPGQYCNKGKEFGLLEFGMLKAIVISSKIFIYLVIIDALIINQMLLLFG
ncbi:hypothetical protein HanPI659440_Chr01g0025771 [Helianthus annuus]|nr:hypothetical protein HanPI659440_Chr01g0025771 [Helianthus annuus]